jgi:hypothetical protein
MEASGNGNFTILVPNSLLEIGSFVRDVYNHVLTRRLYVMPARSIFSNAMNFRCPAIAAFVRCRDGIAHSARQETAATACPSAA